MSRWIGVLALVALGCTACNGEAPQTPAGPASSGGATAGASSVTQGARIEGNVSAGVPLGSMAAQVVGTSISSPVAAGGGFSVDGVPQGDVQLRFVGSGVDASVALSPVRPGDVVCLLVGVSGATATVQSESRNAGGKVELEGLIEALTAGPPTTLVVAGRGVTIDASTVIRDSADSPRSLADLAVGQRVHVKGTLGNGTITAAIITIQNSTTPGPPQDDSASVEGIVSGLSGASPTLTMTIGVTPVTTDKDTVVQRRGDVQPLTAIVNGQVVHAVGVRQPGGSITARKLQIKDDATNGPFEIEGSLGGLKGTCPAITFGVNGYAVFTTATTFTAPASSPCGDLKNGAKVVVNGERQADGSVRALTVTKK